MFSLTSRRPDRSAPSNRKSFVFVGGTSRSGTSTFTELLRSHGSLAIGKERYPRLLRNPNAAFDESIFTRDRFCRDLEENDSHHRSLDEYYSKIYDNFENFTHYGDKIPNLNDSYARLFSAFPDAKVFLMIRNIFDVAASFERRAEKAREVPPRTRWPAYRDAERSVTEWNLSMEQTLPLLGSGQFFVVEYERLYDDDALLPEIFAFLGLPVTKEAGEFWNTATQRMRKLEEARCLKLTSRQKRHIMHNARFDLYRQLVGVGAFSSSMDSAAQED